MPRGASTVAPFLQEDLLVHEPNVWRIPKLADDIGGAGFIEQAAIRRQRLRVG
ncbi:MAG TPA: hypothetical protein VMT61_15925 [Candidatus Binataceae bacterium]|nr:hypothetical protein [Candidatus Binataceae bacterium]